jgi:Ca2+:H+ antiporter
MDESINIAVGSSLQIALGMTPLLVLCGWIMHQPMTLLFDPLQTGVIGVVVFVVNFVIIDGKSNWLEGAMLLVSKDFLFSFLHY